jgi:uncharacterized protein YkwD
VVPALIRRLVLPALALAALALPAPAVAADCPGADAPPDAAAATTATVCLINAQRTSRGLEPLATDAQLAAAADAFAQDMVTRRFFDHTSPGGGTLVDRLRRAGWLPASGAWSAGEDIAWGQGSLGTPARIVSSWMASAGHRANILRASFDEVGVGIAAGAPRAGGPADAATYVADFGARATAGATPASATAKGPAGHCARAARRAGRAARRCGRR